RGEKSPMAYARAIRGDQYAGFHLLLGDGEIVHCSNSGVVGTIDGIFAVSNAPPGVHWPKVDLAREYLASAIDRFEDADTLADDLLRFLSTPTGKTIDAEVFVKFET